MDVFITVISDTNTFSSISSGTSCFLVIPFQTFGNIIVNDKPYVRFINAHSEGDCSYNDVDLFHQEFVLIGTSGSCIHAGMIRSCFNAVYAKDFCQFFHFLPAQAIDNSRFSLMLFDKLDNIFCWIILGTDFVIEIRTVKRRFEYFGVQHVKIFLDIVLYFRRSCGCQSDDRRLSDLLDNRAYFTIFGPEIVSPFRDTMCFIDSKKRNLYFFQEFYITVFCQRLRCYI